MTKFVVFSYHNNHQEFVLKIYDYLKRENVPVWIDIHDEIDFNIYRSIDGINKNISIVMCFLTPMYQASKYCEEQLKYARNEGIPVIGISFLPNWKPSGWLNKIQSELFLIDLRGINFQNKMNKLQEKIIWLLENNKHIQKLNESSDLLDRSIVLDDSNRFSMVENINFEYSKRKRPLKYRLLPFNLSNLLICNNEYILIHGNQYFHLFDKNLKLIRSNNELKINENDLKDLSWCPDLNNFLILTKKRVYLLNPITSKLSLLENLKLKDQREEFVCCCCSSERFFVITCQLNSNSFYFEEYSFPSFRFMRKFSMIDLIGSYLSIQNGFLNKNNLQQIISIKYFEHKIPIIMKISFQWFIYVFHFYEQPILFMKIPLDDQSRMAILYPINQWIIFKDYLSNSFIQISMDFKNKSQTYDNYSTGFIDYNGKLRSVALLGTSNLVFLLDDALVVYKF